MAFGSKARDPSTPYLVYAFSWRGKVYYVGIGPADSTRHTHRWRFVENMVEHERQGTLKPDKRAELLRTSNAVIAAMICAGLEAHTVKVLWTGSGQIAAKREEKLQIARHVAESCVLANQQGMAVRHSVAEVLRYLGADGTA